MKFTVRYFINLHFSCVTDLQLQSDYHGIACNRVIHSRFTDVIFQLTAHSECPEDSLSTNLLIQRALSHSEDQRLLLGLEVLLVVLGLHEELLSSLFVAVLDLGQSPSYTAFPFDYDVEM